ncbi:hypothetical protein Pmar_PMAR023021 [Perkinsus marinus ATCC 50983]|uniref:Uncharacterized protein n=1 Tax=Perkinsus marinus (strain ATCC 50983 / TXsc) TaxID=423536 RepID=C5LHW9_PERM5|nr:hypothetical protein Pmar_PMAR023021 [Perkinsus marinus ATCC 50983]EER03723.1 hypothetical protein Pmar_PMAR023021 [Perkinsus marinus ATCC 50983]|eukprot:XP_002771907.1 hypothetical protein Pmar_PMAR023021 [Perkinsus marinus ATCC 50983]
MVLGAYLETVLGPLPVDFHQLQTSAFLLAPPTFTPLNAQACLFKAYDALWGLYLPVTVSIYPYSIVRSHLEQVHGRVSDIWRSFVLQRLLWDLGASVAVAGRTWVRQLRNSHDYLADFIAEDDVMMVILIVAMQLWIGVQEGRGHDEVSGRMDPN